MNKTLKFLPFFLMALLSISFAKAQVGIATYSSEAFGLNTSSKRLLSADIKVFANSEYEYIKVDLSCLYNFKQHTYHRFSAGAGLSFQPFRENDSFRAFVFPLILEIKPLQDFQRLSLLVELAPTFGFDTSSESYLRHLWGIRYTLGN